MNLLLLSSSRAHNSAYLAPGLALIAEQLVGIQKVLFIPYAGISIGYDAYQAQVQAALDSINIQVDSIHQYADPKAAVLAAEAIVIGGGNTFHLLHQLYAQQILPLIQQRVRAGVPYIGWSAGSNLAGLTIRTTNDMPIIQPPSFNALQFLPCQLNPHYIDQHAAGFHGETRDMRLAEFMILEPDCPVIALPEGCALVQQGEKLWYRGDVSGYWFVGGNKTAITPDTELTNRLMRQPTA